MPGHEKPRFNLLDEPWIPCLNQDGAIEELGLLQVFARAPDLCEITTHSPLVTFSLYRLLLAVLHSALRGPKSIAEWERLWRAASFDSTGVQEYLEKWRERFYLFHPERPFYQCVRIPEDEKIKTALVLSHESAAGHNATLFSHTTDDAATVLSGATAAQLVVAAQVFSVHGGKSKPFNFTDSPSFPALRLWIRGDNLFQSLCLNTLCLTSSTPMPVVDDDMPIWERDHLPEPVLADKEGVSPRGYLDYLTWQSRRCLFVAPREGVPAVSTLRLLQGLPIVGEVREPFTPYRQSKKSGWVPVGLSTQKALWRNAHVLLNSRISDHMLPAQNLAQMQETVERGLVEDAVVSRLEVFGLANDQAKIEMWRHEQMPFLSAYLEKAALIGELEEALQFAEQLSLVLKSASTEFACALEAVGGTSSVKARGNRKRRQDAIRPFERFWPSLESHFYTFLHDHADRGFESVINWVETVRAEAGHALDASLNGLQPSAENLQAAQAARRAFYKQRAKYSKPYKEALDER